MSTAEQQRVVLTVDRPTVARLIEIVDTRRRRLTAAGATTGDAAAAISPTRIARELLGAAVESLWEEEVGDILAARHGDRDVASRAAPRPVTPAPTHVHYPASSLAGMTPAALANLKRLQAALPGLRPEELGGQVPPADSAPSALGGNYADPAGCSHRETEAGPAVTTGPIPTPADIEATVGKAKAARGKLGAEHR